MEEEIDYKQILLEYEKQLILISNDIKILSNDKVLIKYFNATYTNIYSIIYHQLVPNNDNESESLIREFVKLIIVKILPIIEMKMKNFNNLDSKNQTQINLANDYLQLYDNYYAIASFRSLIHFAQYMETQDNEEDKVWKYNMNVMGGIFYYANSMILNKQYHAMVKQCPTSYGKSKSDNIIVSFIFGYDSNATVLKLIGNPSLIPIQISRILSIMTSPKYGKVFPQYGKYNGNKFKMCRILQASDGKIAFTDSKSGLSLYIANKDTPIDGGRFQYLFFDDVTRSTDMDNIKAHEKDVKDYDAQWSKRVYNDYNALFFFTGTAYHREDFISVMKRRLSKNQPLIPTKHRYTSITSDQDAIFVIVPKLDENDESTFPEKCSTEKAKALRAANERTFYAMEQQTPLASENLPYDYMNLKTYTKLPAEIMINDCRSVAMIDPARKAKNYVTMGIFKQAKDGMWYFVDVFYKKVLMRTCYDELTNKIIRHNVDLVINENNTDTSLEYVLKEKLTAKGYTQFTSKSIFSTQNKEDKIGNQRDNMVLKIVYPAPGMFHDSSDMGKCMLHITTYSTQSKVEYDDGPDMVAMFCKEVIDNDKENTFEVLDGNRVRF